jgi:pyruvate,water dikinase
MTVEANRALEDLSARIRSDPVLVQIFASHEASDLWAVLDALPTGREFLVELRAFLDRYGHREVVLSTVLQPTWKDAPELVLDILKGFALADPRKDEGRQAWEKAQEKLLAHPMMKLQLPRSTVLGILKTARCLWQIREDTHFNATLILPVLRRTLLEMGSRLTEVQILDAPADVFHLEFGELELIHGVWPPSPELGNHLRRTALRRKERRAFLEGTPLVDPRFYQRAEPGGDVLLQGTPGSPGIVEGPVRVIRSAADFGKLRPGDVLVAPYTNPAWTPLFGRAAAVVVDGGAAGSHAAIVAREYNLPAVMGTVTGTQTLVDGEWVRVDGYRGAVQRAHFLAIETPQGKHQFVK